jgi:predicted lipoprotein with Yx(FWY)xxD motif
MIRHLVTAAVFFAALGLTAAPVYAAAEPAKIADTSKGKAWVDTNGMALYTFGKDTKTKSKCNDQCAAEWPPLAAMAADTASGKWTVIKRDDGSLQWAYNGHPLYTFVDDKQPGEVTGDGKDGFHLAKAKMTASSAIKPPKKPSGTY